MKYKKEKIFKNHVQNCAKKNKTPRNKFNQGEERSIS